MPVITAENNLPNHFRHALVKQLAEELAGHHTDNPPLIYEVPIRPSGTLHVIVVWDQWASLPPQERSAIIVDAYAERSPQITIAMGTTWDEVDRLNLLPYRIEPNFRKGEANPDAVKKAMLEAGGVENSGRIYLRFASRPQADSAFENLNHKLPEAHWSLNQVAAIIED